VDELDQLPGNMVERLTHYFCTYKLVPGEESSVSVALAYDRAHAFRVIEAAIADYQDGYEG
jgi:inorganic pyrophosphatase